jgi:hypothetical protein
LRELPIAFCGHRCSIPARPGRAVALSDAGVVVVAVAEVREVDALDGDAEEVMSVPALPKSRSLRSRLDGSHIVFSE